MTENSLVIIGVDRDNKSTFQKAATQQVKEFCNSFVILDEKSNYFRVMTLRKNEGIKQKSKSKKGFRRESIRLNPITHRQMNSDSKVKHKRNFTSNQLAQLNDSPDHSKKYSLLPFYNYIEISVRNSMIFQAHSNRIILKNPKLPKIKESKHIHKFEQRKSTRNNKGFLQSLQLKLPNKTHYSSRNLDGLKSASLDKYFHRGEFSGVESKNSRRRSILSNRYSKIIQQPLNQSLPVSHDDASNIAEYKIYDPTYHDPSSKNKILLNDFLRLEGPIAKDIFLELLENGMEEEMTKAVYMSILNSNYDNKVIHKILTFLGLLRSGRTKI